MFSAESLTVAQVRDSRPGENKQVYIEGMDSEADFGTVKASSFVLLSLLRAVVGCVFKMIETRHGVTLDDAERLCWENDIQELLVKAPELVLEGAEHERLLGKGAMSGAVKQVTYTNGAHAARKVFYITEEQVTRGAVAMGLQDIIHGLRSMMPDLSQELGGDDIMFSVVGYKRVSLQPCMDKVAVRVTIDMDVMHMSLDDYIQAHLHAITLCPVGLEQHKQHILHSLHGQAFGSRIILASTAFTITRQFFQSLVDLHSANLVHCDLKPANTGITIADPGKPLHSPVVKLLDMGAAKAVNMFGWTDSPEYHVYSKLYASPYFDAKFCTPCHPCKAVYTAGLDTANGIACVFEILLGCTGAGKNNNSMLLSDWLWDPCLYSVITGMKNHDIANITCQQIDELNTFLEQARSHQKQELRKEFKRLRMNADDADSITLPTMNSILALSSLSGVGVAGDHLRRLLQLLIVSFHDIGIAAEKEDLQTTVSQQLLSKICALEKQYYKALPPGSTAGCREDLVVLQGDVFGLSKQQIYDFFDARNGDTDMMSEMSAVFSNFQRVHRGWSEHVQERMAQQQQQQQRTVSTDDTTTIAGVLPEMDRSAESTVQFQLLGSFVQCDQLCNGNASVAPAVSLGLISLTDSTDLVVPPVGTTNMQDMDPDATLCDQCSRMTDVHSAMPALQADEQIHFSRGFNGITTTVTSPSIVADTFSDASASLLDASTVSVQFAEGMHQVTDVVTNAIQMRMTKREWASDRGGHVLCVAKITSRTVGGALPAGDKLGTAFVTSFEAAHPDMWTIRVPELNSNKCSGGLPSSDDSLSCVQQQDEKHDGSACNNKGAQYGQQTRTGGGSIDTSSGLTMPCSNRSSGEMYPDDTMPVSVTCFPSVSAAGGNALKKLKKGFNKLKKLFKPSSMHRA